MKRTLMFSAAIIVLSLPALADQRGDDLVRQWFTKRHEIQPVAAETTTTYTFGKWTARYRLSGSITGQNHFHSASALSTYDANYPRELMGDPLQDNLNPLLLSEQDLGVLPNGEVDRTKYIGKETIDGTEYDVVQLQEYLYHHGPSRSQWLDSVRHKEDHTILIKWYLNPQGEVRRMTFSADIDVTGTARPNDPSAIPAGKHRFTATMVVTSFRKSRQLPARNVLPDPLFSIDINTGNVQPFAFSPDGNLLAIATGTPQIISTQTGMPAYTLKESERTHLTDFSANGKYVAFSYSTGVKIFRTSDGQRVQTIDSPRHGTESLRMSPDGSLIAITGPDTEIWNVSSGKLERVLKDNGMTYEAIFSANGKRLVTAGYNAETVVWDTSTWTVIHRLPIRANMFLPIAVSADGSRIALATEDNGVQLWDGVTGKPARELKGTGGSIRFLRFSNDGKKLYASDIEERDDASGTAPGYLSWNVETGSVVADFGGWTSNMPSLAGQGVISPDGRFAAFKGRWFEGGWVRVHALTGEK